MHRYLPDKWSIKQLLGHITDHERIMIYRALRVSRRDETVLPGYDQELLVANSRFDEMEWTFLLDDFAAVRNSTIRFIESLSKEQFQLQGHVWQYEISVEDILRATIGHELHHVDVIKNKYLKNEF